MKNPARKCVALVLAMSPVMLTGCKDEEQTKKIKELEERVAEQDGEIQSLADQLSKAEQERDQNRGQADQAKREAQHAKDQMERAQRQLDQARAAEQQQRESVRQQAARNPAEEAKKAVEEKLKALCVIEGDAKSTHGVAVESDGKTWLYFPANGLGASTKLSVKDGGGNAITKFGELQTAADINLARLEIKQDVASRYVLDSKAALGATGTLLMAIPTERETSVKLEQTTLGESTPLDLEINLYNPAASNGYPVFSVENGALIGLTLPGSAATASLWEEPAGSETSQVPRAARIDRTIDWKPSNIGALLAERRRIIELNKLSRLLVALGSLAPTTTGFNLDAQIGDAGMNARQILEEHKSHAGIQELMKLQENLAAQKVRVSESDLKKQIGAIFGQFVSSSRRIAAEARAAKPTPCNRQDMENALKWNEEAEKKLAATLENVGRK